MSDVKPLEQVHTLRQSDLQPGEKFKFLRERINQKLPQARRIQRRRGWDGTDNRLAINTAAELAREQIQHEVELEKATETDSLTGALNEDGFKNRFELEIASSTRNNTETVLIFLDSNNLKQINDRQGHDAGTKYIIKIAEILQSRTRQNTDAVARWGGDEYAVILANTSLDGAREWWKQIEEAFHVNGVSIAAGATSIKPDEIEDPTQIKKIAHQSKLEADKALYDAKEKSKNAESGCVMITTEDLQEEIRLPQAA